MAPHLTIAPGALVLLATLAAGCGGGEESPSTAETTAAGESSSPEKRTFSDPADIDNPYAPLTEFQRCVLEGTSDEGSERVVRTLLDRTKAFTVEGRRVDAAVIEDRAFAEGELVERTLDYFAQADDGTVHYLGEDVDNYENGKIANHDGSFLYGEHTDHLGVLMPGDPQVGDEWYFEKAPPITVEKDRLIERVPRATVAGERYEDLIRIRELIDGEEVELKLYARDIGVVQESPPDGEVHLVRCV
ncbi:MAG: hypothetical protein ACR2G3_10900 [Solirubrobacterales bacterium]